MSCLWRIGYIFRLPQHPKLHLADLNQVLWRSGSLVPPALLTMMIGKRWREACREREELCLTPNLWSLSSA